MPQTHSPSSSRQEGTQKNEPNPQAPHVPTSAGEPSENEGEGSRTAARRYNRATEQYARSGRVDAAASAARKAIEGPEREELERAEESGKADLSEREREGDRRGLEGEREGPDDDEKA